MAAPKRFFVERIGEEVLLTGDEFRHAKNVLRLAEGDEVTLLNGDGAEYTGIVARTAKGEMLVHVTGRRPSEREPKTDVYLLVGALKGDKTEFVVQKAAELGVSKIGVFTSRYCAVTLGGNKKERLERVAREAAKQCLRATVPKIECFGGFEEAMKSAEGFENKLFACEFIERSEREIDRLSGACALVVGSEGGFHEEEFEYAKSLGFAGVSLGRRILRAETAAIVFTGVVMHALGELS